MKLRRSILDLPTKKKLSKANIKVLNVVLSKWPINPQEIAETFGDRGKPKTLSAKYLYHLKKLDEMDLIAMKKLGNTYVAWPQEIEKLRDIQELFKEV